MSRFARRPKRGRCTSRTHVCMNWIPALAAGACATVFCGLWWRLMRGRVLAMPCERSLHARPTPTGGGIGITAALVAGAMIAAAGAGIPLPRTLPLLLPAGVLCLLGLIDDVRGLGAWTKLAVQAACAAWLISVMSGAAQAPAALLVSGILLVGFTNAFNFMDGIDGLAATQATFVGLAGAVLLSDGDGRPEHALLLALAGTCAAGFLVWNWPPARLFMGDAGSLPLGFLLAALALEVTRDGSLPAWCWLILWAPFLCDAGITLLARAMSGKPLFSAHREHAYQRLATHGHRRVTLGLLIVDVGGLLPLAWLAAGNAAFAPIAATLALAPFALLVVAVRRRHAAVESAS